MIYNILFLSLLGAVYSRYLKQSGIDIPTSGPECTVTYGIPYAQPPVGKLRLMKPLPNPNWRRFSGVEIPPICPQIHGERKATVERSLMSEDCLYLNVYAEKNNTKIGLSPVLFFIHGGSFKLGSMNEWPEEAICENLITRNVVVVTVQYRLGLLGFFSSNSTLLPGNLALHDLVMALEWVHENIHEFGGDRSRVTVVGHSAGACAANALAISDVVPKQLFSNVILQSGVASICFEGTYGNANHGQANAKRLCNINTDIPNQEERLLKCLQERDVEEILEYDLTDKKGWKMVVDGYFFDRPPMRRDRKSTGKKYLIGSTSDEWAFFEHFFLAYVYGKNYKYDEKQFDDALQSFGGVDDKFDLQILRGYYANESKGQPDWIEAQINALSDVMFDMRIVEEVENLLFGGDDVHLYTFDIPKEYVFPNGKQYATHVDDLHYLFTQIGTKYPHMLNVWSDFLHHGKIPLSSSHRRLNPYQAWDHLKFIPEFPFVVESDAYAKRAIKGKSLLEKGRKLMSLQGMFF